MDRRLHERVEVQFEAKVTTLKNRETAYATVSDISQAGISVALPMQLTPGDKVQIEMADCHLSGNVIYSNPEAPLFRTGIAVARVELGGSDLSQLLQRTLAEVMPETPGVEYQETYLG